MSGARASLSPLLVVMLMTLALRALPGIAQVQTARVQALVDLLRPVLPYPEADVDRDVPAGGSVQDKWFVIWPGENESRVIVRANPLNPETQRAGAKAMQEIQQAVIAAERRAQAAYDRAIEELRRTGKATDLEVISLDDEGAAGERIDAELELTIDLDAAPASFELGTASTPVVTTSDTGPSFVVRVPPNMYREVTSSGTRQRFRAAEARLYFGVTGTAAVSRRDGDRYAITLPPAAEAFAVVLRGNETLLNEVLTRADWRRLRPTPPLVPGSQNEERKNRE